KLCLNIVILSSLLVVIPFHHYPANAIETVKASALVPEDTRKDTSLSFTKKAPPHATGNSSKDDPCLPLLSFQKGSQIAAKFTTPTHFSGRTDRLSHNYGTVDKTAAPAALSFILGVRIALGPKDIVPSSERVQIASEILSPNKGGNNHALAVAAYRSCKNEHALRQK
ncbi:MAG: hypothetical protein AAF244_03720, partial [Pseudomonadota bacterium]